MATITTDKSTERVGRSINGSTKKYADEKSRAEINKIFTDLAYAGQGFGTCSTAATTAAGTTTATTEPGEAISVIRPEKRATLPDFGGGEKTEATLTDATGTDAEKTGGAGYYIGGAVGIAAVAAAVVAVLVKKKKR